MQQILSNFMNMVQAMLAVLDSDVAYWENEPEIVKEINAVRTLFNSIMEANSSITGLDHKSYTVAKNNDFDNIIASTIKLCKKICVYARRNGDLTLLALVNLSPSALSAGIEKDAINRCITILKKAESLLPLLEPYKVTREEINRIYGMINSYNIHINGRSTTRTSKSILNLDIDDQTDALREHLTMLDDLIDGFIDNNDMIARYKVSRAINNYGHSKTAKKKEEGKADNTTTQS